ncbi:LysR family transcriptional regulator [Roseovarius pelagicus]|uniref:LysR family transcriptional regulator n=1 Tax=Roseovarius pelagicus TaxID=2980108 RepID=A0ABY6D909_9RHOB|nr:LysR family transcriptional regulator [Roseovarius pelagicus]UXX82616.1 LysR family transcriptional regulator [Roseovarius pelagicus]
MPPVTHLKSLQALELAIREGSLKAAARRLGITPAAVGQRIRALEDYLGSDLLLRARSGLRPTAQLEQALDDLHHAFSALERVTETLDFQRVSEIHIVADPDWSELWLAPRLPAFRDQYPNILFCINGAGDVPLRLGTPDLRITYGGGDGAPLFRDVFLPVTGPDNTRRIADWDPVLQMEGMPLLHLQLQRDDPSCPGWPEWFAQYGHRESGPDRGVHYKHARHALEAVRQNVGFLICGLSLTLPDLDSGRVVTPFAITHHIPAPHPYRLNQRSSAESRPQVQCFVTWLMKQARETQTQIDEMTT